MCARQHFDFVAALERMPEESILPSSEPDSQLVLSIAIKAADIGHVTKPWELHYKWTQRM